MTKRLFLLLLFCLAALPAAFAQTPNVRIPDCQFTAQVTATGRVGGPTLPAAGFDNRQKGCTQWTLAVTISGFSATSITMDDAQDGGGSASSWASWQGTITTGSLPITATTSYRLQVTGFYPWVSVNLATLTGTGVVTVSAYGFRDSPGGSSAATGCGTAANTYVTYWTDPSTICGNAGLTYDATATNTLTLTRTWNNVATTFTVFKMNVTDTTSAAGSLLLDLQVGGTERFSVGKSGTTTIFDSNGTTLTPSTATKMLVNYIGASQNGLGIADTSTMAIDQGATIAGYANTSGTTSPARLGVISILKENGTISNSAGYISFLVNSNSALNTIAEVWRISSAGLLRPLGDNTQSICDATHRCASINVVNINNGTTGTVNFGGDVTLGNSVANVFAGAFYNSNTNSTSSFKWAVGASFMAAASGWALTWSNDGTLGSATKDTSISRISPGIVGIGTGAAGSTAGTLQAAIFQPMTALVALGGGTAPTLGTIGGSGPTSAAQNSWVLMKDSTGASFWVAAWK